MNLEESNEFVQVEKSKRKKKKIILFLIILCVIAVLALVFLISFLRYKDENTKKIFLNQERKNLSTTLFIEQDGNTYVSTVELSNFLGYKYHPGEYNKYNQDENYCYIESDYEVVSVKADSKSIKKYIINENDISLEDDEDKEKNEVTYTNANTNTNNQLPVFIVKSKNNAMELFELSSETIIYNNIIYIPIEDIEKIFNIRYEVNANRTYISDLYYLYQSALNIINNNIKYTEMSNYYENVIALVDNFLIVKDDTNKYGVISLETGETIIDFIYTDIQYLQNTEEFFVYTKNSVGLITKDKKTIISPISYDELSVFDEINQLYLVKSKRGYGILNRKGENVVPDSFDNIGFSSFESYKEFEIPDSETPNLLESKYIVVYENEKLGLYDVDGNIIIRSVYDNFGYVQTDSDKKDGIDSLLLLPKESGINGIVIEQNGLYGIFDLDNLNLAVPCSLSKVYSITQNGETNYYMVFEDEIINISEYFADYNSQSSDDESYNDYEVEDESYIEEDEEDIIYEEDYESEEDEFESNQESDYEENYSEEEENFDYDSEE